MRFSSLQRKEVIELEKGTFLGFVQDAVIDIENGRIEKLHVGEIQRSFFSDTKGKGIQKLAYGEVMTVGKDIILVRRKHPEK